jgi:hypothetical protein
MSLANLERMTWFSGKVQINNNGSCAEVVSTPGKIALRDSKDPSGTGDSPGVGGLPAPAGLPMLAA